ncbi:MAG TPA: c-type cytochrome [Chitinophagaceae bacterium]|nr:c-type cytochrome [Chitinophagaceae bacterium]
MTQKPGLLLLLFIGFSIFSSHAQDGQALFQQKCQQCHNIFRDVTGPALMNLEERGQWSDHKKILAWVNNPSAFMLTDKHTQDLKAKFGSMMQAFPDLTIKDVDAIVGYINKEVVDANNKPKGPSEDTKSGGGGDNAVIFGVISLILAIIALILMQVNSNLKKMSDDVEGIVRPDPVPFYRNKVYIAMIAILLFVVGGYYVTKGAIGLGRQKNYQPVQPIFYSHKVHAGLNQISCLYCHGSAWESKQAAIPAVNICMNCHKAINEYTGPKLYDESGNEVDANAQLAKLYEYAGFDPKNKSKWDPTKAKPIEWVRIHNLPDHVYFNHSQHIRAGKVQCQTCHGEITAMDEVKQFSELSMGWCINCHRQTKVDFNYDSTGGNKFYSIYEKFHNDFKAGRMDSIRVKDIGGLECQKCHY